MRVVKYSVTPHILKLDTRKEVKYQLHVPSRFGPEKVLSVLIV